MLTKRQRDIAGLVAEGWTSQQIADRFAVSKSNIDQILFRVYKTLGCKNRLHMISIVKDKNLINQTAA